MTVHASSEQPEQQETDRIDPISAVICKASDLARRGDFRLARNAIARARGKKASDDVRLDALDRSFRLDPAVVLVVALTSAVLALIAALTLFR